MPNALCQIVISITQPPRLVEISIVTTKTEITVINPDGTRVPQEPETKTETIEKWSVKAMVDEDWVGVAEEEFLFPTEAACAVITPGYKRWF